jgi:nitrate reductase gamma subunit
MEWLVYLITYLGFGVFVVAVVTRAVLWARLPMHLRWELYPVAHEGGPGASYGGSFMEVEEWWNKPRPRSRSRELRVMLKEMLFLDTARQHDPALWIRSFPFHFGLYLTGLGIALALAFGVGQTVAPAWMTPGVQRLLRWGVLGSGVTGISLGLLGAVGLLVRRLTDTRLRASSTRADLFNLAFFTVTLGLSLLTFVWTDPRGERALAYAASLVRFDAAALPGAGIEVALPIVTVVLSSLLLAYIPLTHMSHFIGKFFAYHAVRWDDAPNVQGGGPGDATIERMLGHKVTWAAEHIQGGGKKTWGDVAAEKPS